MQLRLDASDRLVELVEERRAPVSAAEAALHLFALRRLPSGLARTLLTDVVEADARLAWVGEAIGLERPLGHDLLLEQATFVVVDLETTGLSPGRAAICEIGAVRVRQLELEAEFETLVRPPVPLGPGAAALTGLSDELVRRAPSIQIALPRFVRFAGEAVLAAHNARFDLAFLDRETERAEGARIAATVVDTLPLARRLLGGRSAGFSLAQLAHFFGTATRPRHRALPDAQATAEILLALIGLAQERGARSVADLVALATPRTRRTWDKRTLAFGAPSRPGVYLFRDAHEHVLYVGRARDLRARLRSYFRSERQRPAVEAALAAVARIEWRVTGSELEAALEELLLIEDLRPPANARVVRPERHVWLRGRGDGVVVSTRQSPVGPLRSHRTARLAARLLTREELERPADALPRLRRRIERLAAEQRFEEAGRLRDGIGALERVCAELRRLQRVRELRCCVLAPAVEPGYARAFFVAGGRIAAARTLFGAAGRLEVEAGLVAARHATAAALTDPTGTELEQLLLIDGFLRRPPPELRVTPLRREPILVAARAAAAYSAASAARALTAAS